MRGDGFFRGVIRHGVGRGESGGLGFADGARGGGDVFEVEPEGVEDGGLRCAVGRLAGFGEDEFFEFVVNRAKKNLCPAAGDEVGGVVAAECLDAGCAVFTEFVAVVHGVCSWWVFVSAEVRGVNGACAGNSQAWKLPGARKTRLIRGMAQGEGRRAATRRATRTNPETNAE